MFDFKAKIKLLAAVALSVGLLGTAARLPAQAQSALLSETQNGITYVSGGVGEGSLDAIDQVKKSYNLHLLFAIEKSGQYLSGVNVEIKDAQGKILVVATSDGPYFLAKLPAGKYRISADNDGKSQTKSADLSGGRSAALSFYWPATD